jgi:ubiquinone/menaquinone biosynthesis C-methylase UbiE
MTDSATDKIRDAWHNQADHWYSAREALLQASRPVHEWLVEHVAPSSGQRLLEIAAGPGDTGFLAAQRLGSGRLLSTDIAAGMVEAARRRGAELGVENVDYRVLDAQAMDLDDASFDGVLCRWGFMLMPDPAAALRECRRVLVPSGRLAFAVFTGADENPFASLPVAILREMGLMPPPAPRWSPGILALGDRARLDALLADVGFASVSLETVDMAWTFANMDGYWAFLVELTALAPLVRALPPDRAADFRRVLEERLRGFERPSGLVLPSRCWCGLATR